MITIRRDGWEVEVDTVEEAHEIMKTPTKVVTIHEPTQKRKYTKRHPKWTKKFKKPHKTGKRHKCAKCGKGFLSPNKNAKYCCVRCAGQANIAKARKTRLSRMYTDQQIALQ